MNDPVNRNAEDNSPCAEPDRTRRFECYVRHCRPCAEAVCQKFWHRLWWRQTPEDCVQETLMRAWERFDSFRGETPSQFCEWLKSIAYSRSTDTLRNRQGQFEAGANANSDTIEAVADIPAASSRNDPAQALREQENEKQQKTAGELWNRAIWDCIERQEEAQRRLDIWNAYQDRYLPEDSMPPATWQQLADKYKGTPQRWEQKLAALHFEVKANLAFMDLPRNYRWSGSDYERFRLRVFEGRSLSDMPRHLRAATVTSAVQDWKKTVAPVLNQTDFIGIVERAIPIFKDAHRTDYCCELFRMRVADGEDYFQFLQSPPYQTIPEAQSRTEMEATAHLQALWQKEIAPIARRVFEHRLRSALKMS